jgi:hypothetical protein
MGLPVTNALDHAAQLRSQAIVAWEDARAAVAHAQRVQHRADTATAAALLDAAALVDQIGTGAFAVEASHAR